MTQSGVWWGQMLLSAVNPSCLLVQQQSLALDFYGSPSGGGTRVVSLSALQSDLQEGFIGKLRAGGETPSSPRNRKKSSNQQLVPVGRALLLMQHRPASSSWGKKSSSASGWKDLTPLTAETQTQVYGDAFWGNNCTHFWITNVFTLVDIQPQARCEYAFLFFFDTKCDSPIYAASNKAFGDYQVVNLD